VLGHPGSPGQNPEMCKTVVVVVNYMESAVTTEFVAGQLFKFCLYSSYSGYADQNYVSDLCKLFTYYCYSTSWPVWRSGNVVHRINEVTLS